MRTAFLALLLVNLMFLGWSEWINVPVLPPNAIAGLPRLRLAAEARPSTENSFAVPAPDASAGASDAGQAVKAPEGGAASAQLPAAPPSASTAFAAQCVSIGPFDSATGATRALKRLAGQNFSPRQRVTQSKPARWYWVYLPGPGSPSRLSQVLQQLRADGIEGAQPMSADGKQPISLGMFEDRQLAVRQQELARRKTFHPVLADRLVSQPMYWLDLWVPGGVQALPPAALKTGAGRAVGTQSCPAGEKPPWSVPQAASPGLPAPRATASTAPPGP